MKDHLPWESNTLWVCPQCGGINAFNHEEATRAEAKCRQSVAVSHGSCFDNICGHCGADIVKPDSPILSPCYTHSED